MKYLNNIISGGRFLVLTSALVLIFSCNEDDLAQKSTDLIANQNGTNTQADFTRYISLGNSLTAGYMNGTVYISGQKYAYPALLAQRFKEAQPMAETFKIPYVKDEIGGLLLNGSVISQPRYEFVLATKQLAQNTGTPTTDVAQSIGADGPYGNLGVPGAKSYHLLANGYGNLANLAIGKANSYFAYFVSSPDVSVLAEALAQEPTFFSLWIGNNDVLGYASSGGDEAGVDQKGNTDPTTYGSNDISDPNVVIASIESILTQLTANRAKGVVANIPAITSVPYFTTVPYNPITEEALIQASGDQAIINTLNSQFGMLNTLVSSGLVSEDEAAKRQIVFTSGNNAVLIKDISLTDLTTQIATALQGQGLPAQQANMMGMLYGQARQANSTDLLLLRASSIIGTVNTAATGAGIPEAYAVTGVTYPLTGAYVLTAVEQEKITNAITAYNQGIQQLAQANENVTLVDTHRVMSELSVSGGSPKFEYDGVQYTTAFVSGSAFSLDGVHLTGKGYAVVANEFVKVINETYGTKLLEFNPNDYEGIPLQ